MAQFCIQRLDDRGDGGRFEAGRGRGELGHPDGGDLLDLDVVGGHGALPLDDLESRLDLGQPGRVGGQPGL
jgi:hypothetical protein